MAFVSLHRPSAPTALTARFSATLAAAKTALRQRRMFRKTINELGALSDRELNDLGLCRSMIQDVARSAVYN